jgi:hypothetical protein
MSVFIDTNFLVRNFATSSPARCKERHKNGPGLFPEEARNESTPRAAASPRTRAPQHDAKADAFCVFHDSDYRSC